MALATKSVYMNTEEHVNAMIWAEDLAIEEERSFSSFMVRLLMEAYKKRNDTEGSGEAPLNGRVLAKLDQLEQMMLNMNHGIVVSQEPVDAVSKKYVEVDTSLDGFMEKKKW